MAVAQARCPPALLGLPCAARWPLGLLDWPSHPLPICLVRFWAEHPGGCSPFAQLSPPAAPGHLPQPEDHGQAPGVTSVGFVQLGAEGQRPYRLRGIS